MKVDMTPQPMPPSGFQFDAGSHTYWLGSQKLPGVTDVLAGVGIIDARWYDEWSRNRGSAVHATLAIEDHGEIESYEIDPATLPYLDAWRGYKAAHRTQFEAIEVPLHEPLYLFGGTPDRVTFDSVIEIKTGGLEKWHVIQGAAYCMLAGKSNWTCVYLHDDGTFAPPVHLRPMPLRYRDVFCGALAVHNWKENGR